MDQLASTVIFFGNGPVAAKCLQGFIDSFGTDALEAVITKTRPPHHKDVAPVEELAKNLGLTVWFANTKSELDEIITNNQPSSKVGVVIDYGVVISANTISYFEKGIINSHFSLLPEWRGADPITYSLLSGQNKTGVSLMLIDKGLDTGPLLARVDYDLDDSDNSDTLTNNLTELSNQSLQHVLPLWLSDQAIPLEQANGPITYSRKLTKNDGILVFTKSATELEREIRAFSGWPKSRTTIAGIDCVITKAQISPASSSPGKITVTDSKTILIGCKTSSLEILELQPAGKNKMPVSAFLNGYGHLL